MRKVEQMAEDARGVLQPALGARHFELTRHPPGPGVDGVVRHYWAVGWAQGEEEPFRQAVLPHPAINLVFTAAYATVFGLVRGADVQTLRGAGWALGVLFRPAGFTPFWTGPIGALTGTTVPATTIFGADGELAWEQLTEADDGTTRAQLVDALIRRHLPPIPPRTVLARDLTEEIADDPTLRRVDDLADRHHLSVRSLQRLFREQVGAPPKWVIRRYRLLEAAERAGRGDGVSWAALALDLGYTDQSHLTRDFTTLVGVSPAEYARACREGRPLPR